MSGDYSFGDEDRRWSLVLVIIRRVNVGLESIEWKSPWVEAVSGIDKVCMSGLIRTRHRFLAILLLSTATQVPSAVSHLTERGQG